MGCDSASFLDRVAQIFQKKHGSYLKILGDTQQVSYREPTSAMPHRTKLGAAGDLSPGICAFLLFGKCVHQVVKTFGLILVWKISLILMSK